MKKILLCLFAVIVMTACSTELIDTPHNVSESTENFLKLELNVDDATRGVKESTTFEEGDAVLVMLKWPEDSRFVKVDSKATYNDGKWVFEDPINMGQIPSGDTRVYVYYPYDAITKMNYNEKNGNIVCDSIDLQEDYLTGMSDEIVNNYNGTIKVTMRHCAARISLQIINDTPNPADISTLNLINDSPSYQKDGTYYATGNWFCYNCTIGCSYWEAGLYPIRQVNDITHYENFQKSVGSILINQTLNAGETKTIDLMMPATTGVFDSWENNKQYYTEFTGIRFNFFANGGEYDFEFTPNWETGKSYTYPLRLSNVNKNKQPEKVYLGFDGDNGTKLYWSNVNLGTTETYPTGRMYHWGDNTGLRPDKYYYSSYISWLNIGTLTPDQDLAKAVLGENWRFPSTQEFKKLVDNCIVSLSDQNGIEGYLFTSKINGNSIFFPKISSGTYFWANLSYRQNNNSYGYQLAIYGENNISTSRNQLLSQPAYIRPVCD